MFLWCGKASRIFLHIVPDKEFNSLWPSDVIWQHKCRSTLAQVMAWCLTVPSHYLNQSWFVIKFALWHAYWKYRSLTQSHQYLSQQSLIVTFFLAVLRHDWDELLHSDVWRISRSRCPRIDGLGPCPRTAHWATQILRHKQTYRALQ